MSRKVLQLYPVQAVDKLNKGDYVPLIQLGRQEDIINKVGDPSSDSWIPKHARATAQIHSRQAGILCGQVVIQEIAKQLQLKVRLHLNDGSSFAKDTLLCTINGPLRQILRAERLMLNFLQYLSGIASATESLLKKIPQAIHVLDTRKTIPGYRRLAKYAVHCGGAMNHRQSLSDMIMLKDNHWNYLQTHDHFISKLPKIIDTMRTKFPRLPICVEVENLSQLQWILPSFVDVLLLDNMSVDQVRRSIAIINDFQKNIDRKRQKKILIEFSGSINARRLSQFTKVADQYPHLHFFASIGALTHTTHFLDMSMEIMGSE